MAMSTMKSVVLSSRSILLLLPLGRRGNNPPVFVSSISTDSSSVAEKLLAAVHLRPGDVMVQNEADSDLGRAVIRTAKERGITTINILANKPGAVEQIEILKRMGGDIVVTESYTNTWYMKRLLSDLPKPSVGLNSSEGSQATAVAKLLKEGATFLTHGKSLPEEVAYPGADRRCVRWAEFLKAKKLTAKTL
ncbi:unnamed protein product [Sphagnum balticum]